MSAVNAGILPKFWKNEPSEFVSKDIIRMNATKHKQLASILILLKQKVKKGWRPLL